MAKADARCTARQGPEEGVTMLRQLARVHHARKPAKTSSAGTPP